MNLLLYIFKRLLAKKREVLPQGLLEHNQWAKEILELYDLPHNDSTRFALATSILHLPSDKIMYSKEYFGNILRKGAANEVAAFLMQEIKAHQKARIEAEELAKKQASEIKSDNEKA